MVSIAILAPAGNGMAEMRKVIEHRFLRDGVRVFFLPDDHERFMGLEFDLLIVSEWVRERAVYDERVKRALEDARALCRGNRETVITI